MKFVSKENLSYFTDKLKAWIKSRKIKNTDIDSTGATSGQVPTADGSGGTSWTTPSGGVPTVTLSLTQIVSQSPLEVQLTNEQYDIFANNKQVLIDLSALGESSVVWNYFNEDNDYLYFGFLGFGSEQEVYQITILKSDKVAEYNFWTQDIAPGQVGSGVGADEGKLLKMDSQGWGILSTGLPYITTAPTAANTDGIKIVVLSSQPSTLYNGYLYLILGSNS